MRKRLIWLTLAALTVMLAASTTTFAQRRDNDPIETLSRTKPESHVSNPVEERFDQDEIDVSNDPVRSAERDWAIGDALRRETERVQREREEVQKSIPDPPELK